MFHGTGQVRMFCQEAPSGKCKVENPHFLAFQLANCVQQCVGCRPHCKHTSARRAVFAGTACTGVPCIPVQAVQFISIGMQRLHGYSRWSLFGLIHMRQLYVCPVLGCVL